MSGRVIVDAQQEAVELRFRQRERAGGVKVVLRGDDHEGRVQFARDAIHGDLLLAHALEERALNARAGAVDFVGEHDVEKTGPGMN